jgi:hypothetical protein
MEKLLFFSAQTPSNLIPIAGQKIAYDHLKELSESFEIHLIFFSNSIEAEYIKKTDYSFCETIDINYISTFQKNLRRLKYFYLPIKFTSRINKKVKNKTIDLIEKQKISHVHFEFTSSIYYIKYLKKLGLKTEIVEHDVTFLSFLRKYKSSKNPILKFVFFLEYLRIKKYELKYLSKFDEVYTLNQKDKELLLANEINNVSVKYPKVDDYLYTINRNNIQPYSIIFVGALHRSENDEGIIKFIEEIFPKINVHFPQCTLYIVGSNPSKQLTKLVEKSTNIVLTGFVESIQPYYEIADIAIIPLLNGAGIKIKTIEALTAKIPTFSTEIGFEGIHSDPNLIKIQKFEDFIDSICNYFNSKYNR